ncbi:MAG: BREX-2 system phosphatase PglZ [Gemmataceae bacterium]
MPGPALSPAQLRSHVAEARRKAPDARVIGVQAAGGWAGGDRVECDGVEYAVVTAGSPLALRAALRAAEGSPLPTVVLTAASEVELGLDARARLARRQLLTLDLWEAVRAQFRARDVDPAARVPAVGRALLEHAPAGGYPPVPTGLLDPGTAWRCVLHHTLGMPDGEPTEAGLVAWAASDRAAGGRYLTLPADLRDAVRRRLTDVLGPTAGVVLDAVEGGAGADALAVGLAFEVVYADEPLPTPSPRPPPGWNASTAAARSRRRWPGGSRGRPATPSPACPRTSPPATAGGPTPCSPRSRRRRPCTGAPGPGACEARLSRYADAVGRAAGTPGPPDPAAVEECLVRLRDLAAHDLRPAYPEVYARAEAAARLLQWLATGPAPPADPAALAAAYRDDLAFADWARDRISGGEAGAALSAAYRVLEEAAHRARAAFNRAFAAALTADDLPGTLPVEAALDAAVVPAVGAGHRVLLILLDGLSWAVAHELLPDLRRQGWQEQTWLPSGDPPPPLLAAVPSVTEFSRASLFCGRLTGGDAAAERVGFAAHPGLAAACDRKHPPTVFHKATVTEGPRGALHDDVRLAVLSEKARAVAVVVNAIDDELAGAEQVRGRWTLDAIRPLTPLLQAARDGGRLVVLAGDHGHVWHRDRADFRRAADAGERWRPASGPPGPGELVVTGRRVRGGRAGEAVIVPWDEGVRYGAVRKGYHGGATPQEMLSPLLLLSHATAPPPKGFQPCRYGTPEWWLLAPAQAPAHQAALPPPPRRRDGHRPDLFSAVDQDPASVPTGDGSAAAVAGSEWIDRLFGSDVYQGQREAAGKHLPADVDVRRSLETLAAAGGSLTLGGFARQAGVPPLRLDGFLAKLQRLLNVDGYEVVRVDRAADRVSLNRPLLVTQFEIG